MILFVDAAALIKLYAAEPGSRHVRQAVHNAVGVYAVDFSYIEVRAALAEGVRQGLLMANAAKKARADFESDWQAIHVVEPDQALLRLASEIAETHGLAAKVAMQLAAMQKIRDQLGAVPLHFLGSGATQALAVRLAIAAPPAQ
jgi:predicted nucleic acid-binding protein